MELQELVDRIQRWRSRQEGTAPREPERAAPPVHEAAYEEVSEQSVVAEEPSGELEVEPESVVSEEPTSEVALEQIEDAV